MELQDVAKSLQKGLNATQNLAPLKIATEHLKDTNPFVPISPKNAPGLKTRGNLRNSGRAKVDGQYAISTWDVLYAKFMWGHRGKFNEPSAKKEWAKVSYEKYLSKYRKMYAAIWAKNKLK